MKTCYGLGSWLSGVTPPLRGVSTKSKPVILGLSSSCAALSPIGPQNTPVRPTASSRCLAPLLATVIPPSLPKGPAGLTPKVTVVIPYGFLPCPKLRTKAPTRPKRLLEMACGPELPPCTNVDVSSGRLRVRDVSAHSGVGLTSSTASPTRQSLAKLRTGPPPAIPEALAIP